MSDTPGKVHAAITSVMGEVGGVAKGRKNPQQGYMFRGIADITKACQPLMAKHGLHVSPYAVLDEVVAERTTKNGGAIYHIRQRIEFRFYHDDGSWFPCVTTGEAMDTGDKTSNKVMSAALKYALIQTFCIPEEDPEADTENDSPEVQPENDSPEVQPGTPKGNGGQHGAPPPSSRSANGAAPSDKKSAPPTNGSYPNGEDPLEELRRIWTRNRPEGLGKSLADYGKWMRETFPAQKKEHLTPQHIKDAYTLTWAMLKSWDAYELERAGMWAAGRMYGPEANDLPESLGGAPGPKVQP